MNSEFITKQMLESGIVGGVATLIALSLILIFARILKIKNIFNHKYFSYILAISMLFVILSIKALPHFLPKHHTKETIEKICISDENNKEHCLDEKGRYPLDCIFDTNLAQKDWCKFLEKESQKIRNTHAT